MNVTKPIYYTKWVVENDKSYKRMLMGISEMSNNMTIEQLDKMKDIPEAKPEDMEWADGYFFSTPTRFGVAASQLRAFIDTLGGLWGAGKLADKTFTATTSAQNPHGGQEATILSLYTTAMHWGAIIVAPGFTDQSIYDTGGNPYGFSTNANGFDDAGKAAVAHQAKRLVEMTAKITG